MLADRTQALARAIEEQQLALRRQETERLELIGRLAGGWPTISTTFWQRSCSTPTWSRWLLIAKTRRYNRQSQTEIRTATEFARDLVAQLLAYSGRGPVLRETVDVASRVSSIVDLLQGMARTSNVELELRSESTSSVEADPTHIGQVLMNLVTNAIEACDPGGRVQVSLRDTYLNASDVEDMMVSSSFREGHFLEARVSDTGRGVPEGRLDRLFEPYFTTREEGSGLGLAAVHGIIQSEGGALAIDSTPGVAVSSGPSYRYRSNSKFRASQSS